MTEADIAEQLARIERENAHAKQLLAEAQVRAQDLRLGLPRLVVSIMLAIAALTGSLAGVAGFILGRALR
jgi:hypothetical protein